MHRFIGNFPIQENKFWIADRDLTHQVREVLRLTPGEKIILSDGKGLETEAEILKFEKNSLEVRTFGATESNREPKTKITIYLAVLKKENFELATQKCVEAGVHRIVPVITKRTVKLGINLDRLKKIIKEAAEQSGRTILPEVVEELPLKKAFNDAKTNDLNIFFSIDAKPLDMKGRKTGSIGIFVGPEGGWEEQEIESAKVAKFIIANLGGLILRAETAAIIAVHDVLNLAENNLKPKI